jgi:peptidoglycan/LPS O-acetylase OafA/YrhL
VFRIGQTLDYGEVQGMSIQAAATEHDATADRRVVLLDALRFGAVLLVIGRHAHVPYDGWSPHVAPLMNAWVRGGWVGVDLFFVLSGFLVSGLLFEEYRRTRRIDLGRFFFRRGMKIYPAFYVLLAATIGQTVLRKDSGSISLEAVVAELLFVQNYFQGVAWHTWSLAVEEHFYVLCALLIAGLCRWVRKDDPFQLMPSIFIGVAALSLGARVINGLVLPYSIRTHLFATHLRLDGLMFGVCLAYCHQFHRNVLEDWFGGRRLLAALVGSALLIPAFWFQLETTFLIYTIGLTAFYLGSGLLVIAAVLCRPPKMASVNGAALLGRHSYSIYLWHVTVLSVCEQGFAALGWPSRSFLAFLISLVGSLVVGVAMGRLIEAPVLKLRERVAPRYRVAEDTLRAPSGRGTVVANEP